MTKEEIRNARKSFAMQLTNMIRDFEEQTGKTIRGINVERMECKTYGVDVTKQGTLAQDFGFISLFKGVYISHE